MSSRGKNSKQSKKARRNKKRKIRATAAKTAPAFHQDPAPTREVNRGLPEPSRAVGPTGDQSSVDLFAAAWWADEWPFKEKEEAATSKAEVRSGHLGAA